MKTNKSTIIVVSEVSARINRAPRVSKHNVSCLFCHRIKEPLKDKHNKSAFFGLVTTGTYKLWDRGAHEIKGIHKINQSKRD